MLDWTTATNETLPAVKRTSCILCVAAVLACSQETSLTELVASIAEVNSDQASAEPSPGDDNTYYVAVDGSDRNSGQSPSSPWKTISKVNATAFEPGDVIYFQRGNTWREQLTVSASGQTDRPIRYGAYGVGPNPRISGTVEIVPHRNAIRNAGFEEFIGQADDGIEDEFLHFFSGTGVEAVTAPPENGGDVAVKLAAAEPSAYLYSTVYLPAATVVRLRWKAASHVVDGNVAIRHRLNSAVADYLQDDHQSWGPAENWDAYPIAGSEDGIWNSRTMEFVTDAVAGMYQIYFFSGRPAAEDAGSYLDGLRLELHWETAAADVYCLGTGYEPKRVLLHDGFGWHLALNGKDFDRTIESLDDQMWIYDPNSGMLYFQDTSGRPPDSGILLEISVPEAGAEGECGIYVDQAHITLSDLSVHGWPDDNPAFSHVGGIAITENSDRVTVSGCEIAFNYRVGIMSSASHSRFTNNRFAYNGGNGFSLIGPANHNHIANNEAAYNGYWGTTGDDGEGIALGSGTSDNLVEWNVIHHNNRHPLSWNPGGLVVYHSNHNILRYNRVYSNYKAGVVIDGADNQFYYNLVSGNGIGYAETLFNYMCNIMVRDYSPDGPGGNKVFNNIFFGGTSDTRWMGNLFINRNCTDTEIRNNVFWGFFNEGADNVQIRVDGGRDLTGTVLSNNVIGPEAPGFIHYSGSNYATLSAYQTGTGQGAGSLSIEPVFLDPHLGDFRLPAGSPLIDAGLFVGLINDFDLNPVDMLPDIGAFEYQPF